MKTITELVEHTNKCNGLVRSFLDYKLRQDGKLRPDYPVSELKDYFYDCYNHPSFRDKDIVAIWNFTRIIQEEKV